MEARANTPSQYSRRLPPPEAWKNPAKWLDLKTGLPRSDTSKLVLPTDHYGFVKPDEATEYLLDYFFWSDYEWTYSSQDPETALDKHHFQYVAAAYSPNNFGGNSIPSRVREIAPHVGLIPRQLHCTFHDFSAEPEIPELDAMRARYQAFLLANQAFSRLITTAKGVKGASNMFSRRAESIRSGAVNPRDPNDAVAQEMMIDFYKRHFKEYGLAVENFLNLEGHADLPKVEDKTLFAKPHLVVKRLGGLANRNHVNLASLVKAA